MNQQPLSEESPTPPPESSTSDFQTQGENSPAERSAAEMEAQSQQVRPQFRKEFTPYVTYTILAVTVLVFIGQSLGEALLGQDWLALLGLKSNNAIVQGQWWRLLTPMLLHGSILHISFNMYALYVLGPGLERNFKRARFLTLYLLSGFAGNVVSFMFTEAPSLGASTAIFGLLGAQGVFIYKNRSLLPGYRRALNQIIGLAAINLIIGLASFIDNWGHFGGLVGGSLFTWLGGPVIRVIEATSPPSAVDERQTADVIRAGIWVGLLFLFLALVTVLVRLN